ncbi:MAG TPA: PqqD family protein [Thermoanaerobaculia bacterium]|nr:PqqD family protein [Thermoanaerobaculia bacterium]
MHVASGIAWQVIDGEAFLVDLDSGRSLGLNATGTLVWTSLDEDLEDIVSKVTAEFGVAYDEAKRDITQFIEVLKKRGLVKAD